MVQRTVNGKVVEVVNGKIIVDGKDRTADVKAAMGLVLPTPDDQMLDAVEGLIIDGLLR